MNRYAIMVGGQQVAIINAFSEYGAREAYYMKHGSASRYSGLGMSQIQAVKL